MAVHRRSVRAQLLVLILLASTWAFTQAAPAPVFVVNHPVANMYSAPTTDSDVVSQAIYGTHINVLERKLGWVKVRTADDYTGWMDIAALLPRATGAAYATNRAEAVVVPSLFANIYREPDVTAHQPLITVPFETRLENLGRAAMDADGDRWLRVRLPDGRQGLIQAGDVAPVAGPLSIEESIALAKRFLGLPYLWGGTSSFGYDCSGFTQMLMRQRGILMPRDADLQAAWSGFISVPREQLRAGDLLFFGSSADNVTHTGMYIGGGQFINATTHERPVVQISPLDDPYWTRLLVGARRPKP